MMLDILIVSLNYRHGSRCTQDINLVLASKNFQTKSSSEKMQV